MGHPPRRVAPLSADAAASRLGCVLGLLLIASGALIWQMAPSFDWLLHEHFRLSPVSPLLPWMRVVTDIGGGSVMIPLALIGCIWLASHRRAQYAIWLLATVASGRLAMEAVKELVHRARPPVADHLAHVSSFSFPSSHSGGSMLTCLALCAAFGAAPAAFAAGAGLSIVIGVTRVMLGVHWPSDVLAGWGLGLAWVSVAVAWRPETPPRSGARSIV